MLSLEIVSCETGVRVTVRRLCVGDRVVDVALGFVLAVEGTVAVERARGFAVVVFTVVVRGRDVAAAFAGAFGAGGGFATVVLTVFFCGIGVGATFAGAAASVGASGVSDTAFGAGLVTASFGGIGAGVAASAVAGRAGAAGGATASGVSAGVPTTPDHPPIRDGRRAGSIGPASASSEGSVFASRSSPATAASGRVASAASPSGQKTTATSRPSSRATDVA